MRFLLFSYVTLLVLVCVDLSTGAWARLFNYDWTSLAYIWFMFVMLAGVGNVWRSALKSRADDHLSLSPSTITWQVGDRRFSVPWTAVRDVSCRPFFEQIRLHTQDSSYVIPLMFRPKRMAVDRFGQIIRDLWQAHQGAVGVEPSPNAREPST